ncbi:MAG: hypothetical protein ACREDQ_06440 [Limisphaerales bacterium]
MENITRLSRCNRPATSAGRRRGDAEVNRIESANSIGFLQRFTGRFAAIAAVQAGGVRFHTDNDHSRRTLNVTGVTRNTGPVLLDGDFAHFVDELPPHRLVINRDGFNVVNTTRLGRCSRRCRHQRGDLEDGGCFQFDGSFHSSN